MLSAHSISGSYIKYFIAILVIPYCLISCTDPFQKPTEKLEPDISIKCSSQEIDFGENYNFGSIVQNGTIEATFIIENSGKAELALTGTDQVTITGPGSSVFAVIDGPDATIPAGGNTYFIIAFTPPTASAYNATVTIISNDPDEGTYAFSIIGTGTDSPQQDINIRYESVSIPTTGEYDIGTIGFGITVDKLFTIENLGDKTLLLTGIASKVIITGEGFSLKADALASSLENGEQTPFTLSFNAFQSGYYEYEGTITIPNDDPDENPYTISVKATSTSSPEINIKQGANQIDNGTVNYPIGTSLNGNSVAISFTIENLGIGDLLLTGNPRVALSGNGFSLKTDAAATIPESGSTTFVISFSPVGRGTYTGTITISNTDSNEDPYIFTIQGIVDPEINVKKDAMSIPNGTNNYYIGTSANGSPVNLYFTVENTGTGYLRLTGSPRVSVSGSGFSLYTDASQIISQGGSSSFVVRFTPSGRGMYTATINIPNEDADENPYGFTIQGIVNPEINVQLGSTDIPSGTNNYYIGTSTNGNPVDITFKVQNTGTGYLMLTGTPKVSVSGTGFSRKMDALATVSQGGTVNFIVTFTPTGSGTYTGSISIPNNDADESSYTFTIQGIINPDINVKLGNKIIPNGASDYIGISDIGKTKDLIFTVENTGTGYLRLIGNPRVSVTGSCFTLKSDAQAIIDQNGTTSFTVSFTPLSSAYSIGTISIANEDTDKNPYTVSIKGKGSVWNKMINTPNSRPDFSDDCALSTAIDSNNNVYVVGHGTTLVDNSNSPDWWIKKFDTNGVEDTVNWDKKYDTDGMDDSAYAVAIDSNNNVYVVGFGYGLVSPSSQDDWWIKKFDQNGVEDTVNWNKKYDNDGSLDYARSVAIDSHDNVYVAGCGTNLVNGSSGDDWWIKKFDQNGVEDAVGWNKKISSAGRNDDVAYSCVIDSTDNVYVAGKGVNLVNGSSGNDWWIKKFDQNGVEDATNWNKKINSPDTYEDSAYSIAIAGNDDVYVAGNGGKLVSSSSGYDWWIKKFDKNGIEDTAQWDKKYNSPGSSYDFAYSIAIQENSVYVAGYGYYLTEGSGVDDWWIKKFDLNGVEDTANWDLKIDSEAGRNDIARSIAIDGNNDIYVVGSGQELIDIFSGTDWWIKKFNAIGEEQ